MNDTMSVSKKCLFRFVIVISVLFIYFFHLMDATCKGNVIKAGKHEWGKLYEGDIIRSFFDISLIRCVEECYRRLHCLAINYQRRFLLCILFEKTNRIQSTEDRDVVYSNVSTWKLELGPCEGRACENLDICEQNPAGERKCTKSECPAPPKITNANLHVLDRALGAKGLYVCDPKYFAIGELSTTCLTSGNWSAVSGRCISCPLGSYKYEPLNKICYRVSILKWTGSGAKRRCESEKGQLMDLSTVDKFQFFASLYKLNKEVSAGGPKYWINSLSATGEAFKQGLLPWINGSTVLTITAIDTCVAVNAQLNFTMEKFMCNDDSANFRFVCEKIE